MNDPEARPAPTGSTDDTSNDDREESRLDAWRDAAIEAEFETGIREETTEQAKRHIVLRIGAVLVGSVVLLAGLMMMVLPGPGLVVTAIGLAILSTEVPFAARLLEKVRERIPEDEDGNVSTWVIVVSCTGLVLGISASVWWSFLR
jgi:uncharacterized protein (TIGR02611 family)